MYNPIFNEYCQNEKAECYKIVLPYGAKNAVVLCKISEGLEYAKQLAYSILNKNIEFALQQVVE